MHIYQGGSPFLIRGWLMVVSIVPGQRYGALFEGRNLLKGKLYTGVLGIKGDRGHFFNKICNEVGNLINRIYH